MRDHLKGISVAVLITGVLGGAWLSSEYSSTASDGRPVTTSVAPTTTPPESVPSTTPDMAGLKAVPTGFPSPTPTPTSTPTPSAQETIVEPAPAEPVAPRTQSVPAEPAPPVVAATQAPQAAYYSDCDEARAAGVAPLYVGEPGYRDGLDRDDDGVACET